MPNLPQYSQPDGPFPNPMDLLAAGKIAEAGESYEEAITRSVKDIVYVCSAMHECGADAIILDTVGAMTMHEHVPLDVSSRQSEAMQI